MVASGPDVVYPPEHRPLWEEVVERGLLLSEVPPGTPPHALRFPLRNRILAALGEVLVVVESKRKGGSLITVDEALLRGRRVFAVPGSPRNEAADGTNELLIDGADPVVRSADLLMALGFERPVVTSTSDDAGPRAWRRPTAGCSSSSAPSPATSTPWSSSPVDRSPRSRRRWAASPTPGRSASSAGGSSAARGQWDDTDEAVPSTRWGGSSTTTSVR